MDNEHENEEELDLKDKVEEGEDTGKEGEPPVDDDPSTPEERAYAKRLGWVPEAEWDDARAEKSGSRKPAQFLTARDYIANTQNNIPVMRERLQRQDRQIQDLNSKITDVHEIVVSQRKLTQEAVKRARQQGIEQAEARMRDAVISGEPDEYDKAKEDLDKLVSTPVPEEPKRKEETQQETQRPAADPVAEKWVAANPWFNEDVDLQSAMITEERLVKRKNPGMPLSDVLEKAKATVMKRYPELFGINPRRDAPSSVSPPSGARQGKTAFDQIPQADKDMYEKQRKMFAGMKGNDGKPIVYTQEEFMREYALV
jgi:hypothetical protein